jgi:hypothetical protein
VSPNARAHRRAEAAKRPREPERSEGVRVSALLGDIFIYSLYPGSGGCCAICGS